ncbi:hypothetical protein TTHERM_00187060 (macronuclear) [Tetrahymena thermophila SB210]|uniref:Uncharacterized protein n=1 Tax=Tetrahymena thermophila (strain SB210) TaxID=312017 RepID=Q22T11_TETTS|nr:hypothetical protein TTHERM_00187060 [Tetrahymena thermophila SB210]EAR88627.2 hypothetical protein TTHERM_00187060 [Tetrahymena thermophila SB210]|eukprot:XP_001008872.2 hypothetical protein TTHERM_00187060 [Tetrahymena thermophila SB210]
MNNKNNNQYNHKSKAKDEQKIQNNSAQNFKRGITNNQQQKGKDTDKNYRNQSKNSSDKHSNRFNQNDRLNRKRNYKERDEDYYDDEKIEERMKSSLNQFFYYDQEKQKYFRKKDEHKNPIWEGSEVGRIDQIEEVEIDSEELPFIIYDMKEVEKNQIYINPRDIIYKYKKKFRLPNEFLYFYELKDIINSFKAEYVEKYFSNQMNRNYQSGLL